ncbi:YitT family protein [Romboutsia sp.]|uniref:YitT family protein n=1 Tax=Romboutsia sp. TaxID=1965302 RepID=UPI002C3AAA5C|nr:YitT family protein [Romboutsia sp.]HSQ89203.1 YitT family protein [Romboutsia sp.]
MYLKELLLLLIGSLLMACSINMFFEPHLIAPGGISGLAIVINSVTGTSLSLINLLLNIPLFIVAYKILSKNDISKTLIGIVFFTACLQFTSNLSRLNATNDPLLACIIGSLLCGLGLGIIFRINGTTGGTDLVGLLVNKFFPNISVAVLMGIADFIVVVLSGIVSKKIEIALYSAVSLYIIVKVTDIIIDGFDYSKSFTIISNKSEEISQTIMNELERGVTFIKGGGAYTKEEKNIILVVVSKRQVVTLKRLIKSIDPYAFTIVCDIHEALGEGFSSI